MDSKHTAPKHITPRSPRMVLEPDTIEIPRRRSTSARHPLVIIGSAIISICVLMAIVAGVLLFIGKQRFEVPGPLAEDRIVNIPRGSSIRNIADVLVHEGVIDQPWVFIGGVLVLKAREDLKAGEYQFKAYASLRDVVATIVDDRVVAHQISIPEGLTSEQIVTRLLRDDVLTGNIKEIPPEGSLLPDTYNFTRGITREQMVQRMLQAQQRLVKEIWGRSADLPIKTPEQLVILASLVQKETGKPEERTRVAAVFVNRLKQKMKLQSDPTIIYGLVGGKGTLGRPIMKSEINQPTPYNTYLIDGLPPGPIANPGRASLEAAANPARTRDLYFVADGTGGHAFAETYEQHQKNVARFRSIATDQKNRDQSPTAQSPTINDVKGKIFDALMTQKTFANGLKFCGELDGTNFYFEPRNRVLNLEEFHRSLENLAREKSYNPQMRRPWNEQDAADRWEQVKKEAVQDKANCELEARLPQIQKQLQDVQKQPEAANKKN
jgi:UPF0755 protein